MVYTIFTSSCCEQPWSSVGGRWWKLRKSHRAMATEAWESHSWVVCQAEAWRVPKARPFLLTPLLPLTSLFYLLSSPYLSTSTQIRPSNPFYFHLQISCLLPHMCAHPLSPPILFSRLSDYGVDGSGIWEQRADQLWWGSQFPEVPPHILCPEPFISPRWRGLGLSLQSRPEGEILLHVIRLSCHHNKLEVR